MPWASFATIISILPIWHASQGLCMPKKLCNFVPGLSAAYALAESAIDPVSTATGAVGSHTPPRHPDVWALSSTSFFPLSHTWLRHGNASRQLRITLSTSISHDMASVSKSNDSSVRCA
ncbi:hypothetical protein BS50DRAFT_215809 [Corynespora cassiicola Philippines]|uniref:Secreted protein n=1 Tax=Corynespora cassiicola Philippines TaxID=1448308 RepID=A0A2T2N3E6_CORCC|nr:hypothetical protein BS50DRAFT_215809 [Corynespora cassiicola Philippines]